MLSGSGFCSRFSHACKELVATLCVPQFPLPWKQKGLFCGAVPNRQREMTRRGRWGGKSCGKPKRDEVVNWEGRRAARQAARCSLHLQLAPPRFLWLPLTLLEGHSWGGFQTAEGGWQGGHWPLWVSQPGGASRQPWLWGSETSWDVFLPLVCF